MDSEEIDYRGFFYDSVSSDIVAKVILNIFLLLSIIFIISLFLSRRCTRLSLKSEDEIGIGKLSELFTLLGVFRLASMRKKPSKSAFSLKFDCYNLILIEKLTSIHNTQKNVHMRKLVSKFPNSLRNEWRGLILSDQFSSWISSLDRLFQCSLQNFHVSGHMGAAYNGLHDFIGLHSKRNSLKMDESDFRRMALHVLFSTVFFHSDGKISAHENNPILQSVLFNLDSLLLDLIALHNTGSLSTKSPKCEYSSLAELLQFSSEFLRPIILFEVNRVSQMPTRRDTTEALVINPTSTLLAHVLQTKIAMQEEEGEDFSFLTTTNLSHAILEVFLVGQFALATCLHTIFAVLAKRPDWHSRLNEEIFSHGKECTNHFHCLTMDSECFRWSKSLCLETIRFTVAGWPFGCLREALCDGHLSEGTFNSGDILLLNEPAVFHDPKLWFSSDDRPILRLCNSVKNNRMPFSPFNFENLDNDETTDFLVSTLLLYSNICFVPRKFIYHSLLVTLIEFVRTGWRANLECSPHHSFQTDVSPNLLPMDCSLPLIYFSQTEKVCNRSDFRTFA